MRIFHTIFLLIVLFANCFSQDAPVSVINLKQLPSWGVFLNEGWKFHAGDNPDYAKAGYDDSRWQSINPTRDIKDLPELWKTNICWLRLHLSIDSATAKKNLSFLIQQTGASEIYLNGRLWATLGKISADSSRTVVVSPVRGSFIPFLADQSNDQVLAVRFALQKKGFYLSWPGNPNPALALTATETKTLSDNINDDHVVYFEFTRFGIYLILAVLHFALFAFNNSQKANLYFFIYAFFECASLLIYSLAVRNVSLISAKMSLVFAGTLLAYLGNLFFILAVYKVFHYKRRLVLWLIAAITALSVFLWIITAIPASSIFLSHSSQQVIFWTSGLLIILPTLEVMRVAFLAIKARQRGATIIISGSIVLVVFLILFVLFAYGYIPAGPNWIYGNFAYNISALSIPVTISVYLALDASFVSRMLKEKLREVQQLSEKTIAQEKEKQEILASQNETLENQVTERTAELKQSLQELKSTQSQLIQQEKMASLGELTAGIAHEIQNPLNFVNNFSEVNKEMIAELKEEINKGNYDEVKMIADDIEGNEEKINHHGKRADAIVKGMLQHSKASTGKKESTNINALCDEYLRLAYHGMRAKDKDLPTGQAGFNTEIKTGFDESIGKINVIPQDIGRVLLNLYNNAFYAVNEKKQNLDGTFEPVVSVSTKKGNGNIVIKVADNGNGILRNIVDKIFQPFFTTKPTGQGTGLGLSLSYDIIKAHGGEIKVITKEDEGSEFIIQLPINNAS